MSGNWGPVIRHDGKGLPVPLGTRCLAVFEEEPNEYTGWKEGLAGFGGSLSWDWRWWRRVAPDGYVVARIVRYRVWSGEDPDNTTQRREEVA